MKIYKVELAEGTHFTNLVVPVGTSFPASPSNGETFFNTTDYYLYIYDTGSVTWNKLARLTGSGNLVLGTSETSGAGVLQLNNAGIMFPSTPVASTDVNTLDDYEEGSWTPSLYLGGVTTGFVYSAQNGKFVKIGNKVHAYGVVTYTTKGSGTGDLEIGGLPYTPAASSIGHVASGAPIITWATTGNNTYTAIAASYRLGIFKQTASGISTIIDTDLSASSSTMYFSCNFIV